MSRADSVWKEEDSLMHNLIIAFCVVLILCPFAALLAVSLPASQNGIRLKFKSKSTLALPKVCVMTGNESTELHVVERFAWIPLGFAFRHNSLSLPFSKDGWTMYKKQYPYALRLFEPGLSAFVKIPFFGPYFACCLWVPLGGFLCGLIAVGDLLLHKRKPLALIGLRVSLLNDELRGIDISNVNEQFATEFLAQNSNMSLQEYKVSLKKQMRLKIGALIALVVVFVLVLVVSYIMRTYI